MAQDNYLGVLGADIQTAEIDDNAITTAKILDANVTRAKLATDALGALVKIATIEADGTGYEIDFDSLDSKKQYVVIYDLIPNNGADSNENLRLELNGDSSAVYRFLAIATTTPTYSSGQNYMNVGRLRMHDSGMIAGSTGQIIIQNPQGNTNQSAEVAVFSYGGLTYAHLGGLYENRGSDITRIKLYSTAKIKGKATLYYVADNE